jgi:hypothetical protein
VSLLGLTIVNVINGNGDNVLFSKISVVCLFCLIVASLDVRECWRNVGALFDVLCGAC